MFDSFEERDACKSATRLEVFKHGLTEVSVVVGTRLRRAGIFVQEHMTVDRQVGMPVPAFDNETEIEPMDYMELQFWCCGHANCERVLRVGRDGCVNEKLLWEAEKHVQDLHGENALESSC